MDDFLKYKIRNYKYWCIYIHQNQGYLGRCIVWCNREGALDLTDATLEEREELFVILKDLRESLKNIFQPDWFNYSFLGNGTRHLHCHFIPRYASDRKFGGTIFKDEKWGHNYRTDHDFKISEELLEQIRFRIKEALD
ncbi:MAG: HIT domain-containing protein [Patescibacteria group bacterium]